MTNPTTKSTDKPAGTSTSTGGNEVARAESKQLDALHTEQGDTTIADQVVAKLAGLAAREVEGVYAMGNAARRTLNAIAERIPGSQTNVTGGVSVEKGERQAAVDMTIITEYGYPIADVAQNLRDAVIKAVEFGTGLEVIEVNINVTDVQLPEDASDDSAGNGGGDKKDRPELQ
ncbi:Asp23/Gls24 family envelope stress response protein [Naumannella cuiyingiana]|uniref:Putative alkaline shock family protein YloU n=1 Tax=Naumannella cuiyingiana TaxID=1347891 RepID=A0A7Z0IJW5_9ACTN|nr:putative alkaline shock family protein YloU [Naumannella cuiyingiana]